MERFVLKQNIIHLISALTRTADLKIRAQIQSQLLDAQRELAGIEQIWSWTCPHLRIPDGLGKSAEVLLDNYINASRADFGCLQIWDASTDSLRLIAQRNFSRTFSERFAVVRRGDWAAFDDAREARSRVVIEDVDCDDNGGPLREWAQSAGVRAICSSPVRDGDGRFSGAISTLFRRPHYFSRFETAASEHFTSRAAVLLAAMWASADAPYTDFSSENGVN